MANGARWVLGRSGILSLDQAREAARAARLQKRDGLCPMAERHKLVHANTLTRAKDKTFQEHEDAYFDFHKDKWQAKWQKDFARHMRDHMLPTLGAIPVSQVEHPRLGAASGGANLESYANNR